MFTVPRFNLRITWSKYVTVSNTTFICNWSMKKIQSTGASTEMPPNKWRLIWNRTRKNSWTTHLKARTTANDLDVLSSAAALTGLVYIHQPSIGRSKISRTNVICFVVLKHFLDNLISIFGTSNNSWHTFRNIKIKYWSTESVTKVDYRYS